MGGAKTDNGTEKDISQAGVALKATAASGYKFVGWVNAENKLLSTKASGFTYVPTEVTTVRAVFAASEPWFLLNNAYVYEGLAAAVEAANGSGTISLMNDATLPAGHYTIPKGVTTLGTRTFYQCSSLASINLPKTLETVGDEAFRACNALKNVYFKSWKFGILT